MTSYYTDAMIKIRKIVTILITFFLKLLQYVFLAEIASRIAACPFNKGFTAYLTIMDLLGIKIGEMATENID